ncbi:MAG: TIGR03620 family F420-dependent LLM class oxidoreductase, partial [Solirubrobacterales bacterium]
MGASPPPSLGRVGLFTHALGLMSSADAREAVREIEAMGFPAVWFPESVGGKEVFTQSATLLSWTDELVVATGIANIAARDPMATTNGARVLSDAYPDRFLLGIGSSTDVSLPLRGHDYARPFSRMRDYLDAMDEVLYNPPEPVAPSPRILAALGPRMLKMAAERSVGAFPGFAPVEHTSFARETMGEGPLLAVLQSFVLSDDRDEAHAIAAEHMSFYLARKPYREILARFSWSEADMEGSGSPEIFEALIPWGGVDALEARVEEHFERGADHV